MYPRSPLTPWILAGWVAMAGLGAWQMVEHATAAGSVGSVPQRLTAALADALHWQGQRPLLVVAAHPQCPCLPSTLDGLTRLLAEHPETELRVLVFSPSKHPAGWDEAQSRTLCEGLPAGAVLRDRDGELAQRLGARTSGHINLYIPVGALAFAGGITEGRGHTGVNAAERALQRVLLDSDAGSGSHSTTRIAANHDGFALAVQTAVFGCPLTDSTTTCHDCCPQ